MVLGATVAPSTPGPAAGFRATSTTAAAGLPRAPAEWTAELDGEALLWEQLWVEDHGLGFTVRLLAATAGEEETERVAAAAGRAPRRALLRRMGQEARSGPPRRRTAGRRREVPQGRHRHRCPAPRSVAPGTA